MREDFAWLQENVFEAAPAVFPPAVFSWDAYVEAHAIAFSRCSILAVTPTLTPTLTLTLTFTLNPSSNPNPKSEV